MSAVLGVGIESCLDCLYLFSFGDRNPSEIRKTCRYKKVIMVIFLKSQLIDF